MVWSSDNPGNEVINMHSTHVSCSWPLLNSRLSWNKSLATNILIAISSCIQLHIQNHRQQSTPSNQVGISPFPPSITKNRSTAAGKTTCRKIAWLARGRLASLGQRNKNPRRKKRNQGNRRWEIYLEGEHQSQCKVLRKIRMNPWSLP